MTTEQDPRLTRAAQLRADAKTLSLAALVRERSESLGICLPSLLWDDSAKLIKEAAALEAEVQSEIDAKAAVPVDEWAEAKNFVDQWELYHNPFQNVAKYVRHLQGRVAELENDECERINDAIDARDTEIAALRAEVERLKGESGRAIIDADLKENFSPIEGATIDGLLYYFEREGHLHKYADGLYAKAAVHYRRKFREAEAKLAAVPELWMARDKNLGIIAELASGDPVLYLSESSLRHGQSHNYEAIPYDGRKSVAP